MALQCLPFGLFYLAFLFSSKCEWKMFICWRASHASALLAQWFPLPKSKRREKRKKRHRKTTSTSHWTNVESKANLACPKNGIKIKNQFHSNILTSGPGVQSMLLLLLSRFSRVRLCVTPETAAHQGSPSMGFSRQEHWSGLPFPSPMHESEKWKWSRSVVSNS